MTTFDRKITPTLFLASQSPRRAELLRQIGIPFNVVDSEIDEKINSEETPIDYVSRMAKEKVEAGYQALKHHPENQFVVLAADTIVIATSHSVVKTNAAVDDQVLRPTGLEMILGKPRDKDHALAMLKMLSGKSHYVVTAFATIEYDGSSFKGSKIDVKQRLTKTRVSFAVVSPAQAEWYWATGEPQGKAGGYAIQGLGAIFVDSIEGSYSGVVGLPLYETSALLAELGIVASS